MEGLLDPQEPAVLDEDMRSAAHADPRVGYPFTWSGRTSGRRARIDIRSDRSVDHPSIGRYLHVSLECHRHGAAVLRLVRCSIESSLVDAGDLSFHLDPRRRDTRTGDK